MYTQKLNDIFKRKKDELLYDYVLRIYNIPNLDGVTNTMKMEFLSDEALKDKNENEGDE